jgi:hypothetical protein
MIAGTGSNYNNAGLCFSESQASNTKMYALTLFWDQTNAGLFLWVSLQKATSATSPGAAVATIFVPLSQAAETTFQVQQDSTNITFNLVQNNRTTVQIFQEAKGTFMTTGTNFFGPCVNARNATYPVSLWVKHWGATTP